MYRSEDLQQIIKKEITNHMENNRLDDFDYDTLAKYYEEDENTVSILETFNCTFISMSLGNIHVSNIDTKKYKKILEKLLYVLCLIINNTKSWCNEEESNLFSMFLLNFEDYQGLDPDFIHNVDKSYHYNLFFMVIYEKMYEFAVSTSSPYIFKWLEKVSGIYEKNAKKYNASPEDDFYVFLAEDFESTRNNLQTHFRALSDYHSLFQYIKNHKDIFTEKQLECFSRFCDVDLNLVAKCVVSLRIDLKNRQSLLHLRSLLISDMTSMEILKELEEKISVYSKEFNMCPISIVYTLLLEY